MIAEGALISGLREAFTVAAVLVRAGPNMLKTAIEPGFDGPAGVGAAALFCTVAGGV